MKLKLLNVFWYQRYDHCIPNLPKDLAEKFETISKKKKILHSIIFKVSGQTKKVMAILWYQNACRNVNLVVTYIFMKKETLHRQNQNCLSNSWGTPLTITKDHVIIGIDNI